MKVFRPDYEGTATVIGYLSLTPNNHQFRPDYEGTATHLREFLNVRA